MFWNTRPLVYNNLEVRVRPRGFAGLFYLSDRFSLADVLALFDEHGIQVGIEG